MKENFIKLNNINLLVKTKIHYGQNSKITNLYNNKFILGERQDNEIFNIITIKILLKTMVKIAIFLKKKNSNILFLNFKKQFSEMVEHNAYFLNQSWVTNLWISGLLTNTRNLIELEKPNKNKSIFNNFNFNRIEKKKNRKR